MYPPQAAIFFLLQDNPRVAGWFLSRQIGEVRFVESLSKGLRELGWQVMVQTARADALRLVEEVVKPSNKKLLSRTLFFLDLTTVTDFYPLSQWETMRCRVRILDFFGTNLNSSKIGGLKLAQFWTPYPTSNNTFLGFTVSKPHNLPRKEKQGLLWGKEPRYFTRHSRLIQELLKLSPLHAVAETFEMPINNTNGSLVTHGLLSPDSWMRLVAKSSYLIGFGDPLVGPSALDAISVGTVYLDCTYTTLRKLESGAEYTSQHPYAQSLGKPFSYPVHLSNLSEVVATAKHVLESPSNLPFVPAGFTSQGYKRRLQLLVQDDFCDEAILHGGHTS
mmetsp:Transcript_14992/g.32218  ORF Transcript_14992/g.32218 Transcript_14992/m.32218 type:complete len:333 (-) Transcript_14992:211-1209(-)